MDAVGFIFVVMGVGSLLDIQVIPCVDIRVIRPHQHAWQQITGEFWLATKCAVYYGCYFCAGNCLVWAESAVTETGDPILRERCVDITRSPVACGVVKL